jgi:2-dehydro-3-deoxygluconokinase
MKRFVSLGECMIEMSGGEDGIYRRGFAGDTFNTAWYARAFLGPAWRVDYVTALGDDLYSGEMLDFMAGHGIGTSHIRRIANRRPGLYMIHQAGGDRHFTYWRGQSAAREMMDSSEAVRQALSGADLVYVSGITLAILEPAARQRLHGEIRQARAAGARIAFDPNVRPALWASNEIMAETLTATASLAHVALPTFGDEAAVFGDRTPEATARRYLDLGAEEVIVKNGAEPALAASGEARFAVAAKPDAVSIDPTGAGDSFNGAYLAARCRGASLPDAVTAGHATAAVVIGQRGALVPHDRLPAP